MCKQNNEVEFRLKVAMYILAASTVVSSVVNVIVLYYIFAQHFLLGSITLGSFIVMIVSGILCVRWYKNYIRGK